jgi:hypothetical protein
MCWTAYLSVLGMAEIREIPYASKVQPLLVAGMLINVVSVWFRARATRRLSGFYLVSAGILAITLAKTAVGWENAAAWGVALTFAGSFWSAADRKPVEFYLRGIWRRPRKYRRRQGLGFRR